MVKIKRTEMWILEIMDPLRKKERWLRHVPGYWGPNHLPTADIHEAQQFLTHEQALEYIQWNKPWSNVVPRRIKVAVRIEL